MNFKYQKITTMTALLVAFAIGQLYIVTTFAEVSSNAFLPEVVPAALMGVLTTTNNKPITINGASATSGATIPSGVTIETPSGVGATIRIGRLGSICIAPNTKLSLEFDQQGNLVKVTVNEGCVILRTTKNVSGVINGAQGALGQIAAATGGSLDVCAIAGAAPAISQGAAAVAGAGASAADCGAAGAAAIPPTGIPPAVAAAFIGGGAAGLYLLFRGSNPSPSAP
ncbi:MAG TPA: hypothetical protein VN956_10670 [Pyrinomonadaceae bacterium]|nr:hypothetical protein [Pyrinomonadaceae bacterium]